MKQNCKILSRWGWPTSSTTN